MMLDLPHPRKFVHRPTVIKYIIGSLDLKITYRPDHPIHSLKQSKSL